MTWSGSSSDYRSFITRHGLTFANIDDSAGDLFGRLGVTGQPAWAMVTPTGDSRVLRGAPGLAQLVEELGALAQSS